jgi:hypothetical protein
VNALQALAVWLGLVAVFMIFWALLRGLPDEPEDEEYHDKDDLDLPGPPPSGA